MQIAVRQADLPGDYAAIVGVLNAENPNWPTTPEEVAWQDAQRDPALVWVRLVAEQDDPALPRTVGVATVGHDQEAHRAGKFKLDIRVRPQLQGRGIGSRLYEACLQSLGGLEAAELYTEVWWELDHAIRFVEARGFQEVWRRFDAALDPASVDLAGYAAVEERVRAAGVAVATFAELAGDPGRIAKLYDLDWELWQDIPYGEQRTRPSLEQFEAQLTQRAGFLPDACFVAVAGPDYVGYSSLTAGEDYYLIEMTGVTRPYRAKGIATALKLRGIRYAQEHGGLELRTVNDSVNRPILELNTKLGFRHEGAVIRYRKQMD